MGRRENNLEPIPGATGRLHLHSVNKNLLGTYCLPGIKGIAVNKMNIISPFLTCLSGSGQ